MGESAGAMGTEANCDNLAGKGQEIGYNGFCIKLIN